MSYTIGQFRKERLNNQSYLTNISYSIVPVETSTSIINQTIFTDFAIQVSNQLEYGNSYYVKIGIKRKTTRQVITISLHNNIFED